MTIRVLVVDVHELLRAGLVTVLSSDPAIEVVAQAPDGPTAVSLAMELRPDVVLMDVEMPGGDGITAIAQLRERAPSVRCLVLTMFDLDDYVVEALRAGAAGFLLKTTDPAVLTASVRSCAAGETTLGPSVIARLVDSYVAHPSIPAPGIDQLTQRELDVLELIAEGLDNQAIARRLVLNPKTVRNHVSNVFAKIHAPDRPGAIVLAHRYGLGT